MRVLVKSTSRALCKGTVAKNYCHALQIFSTKSGGGGAARSAKEFFSVSKIFSR